MARRKTNPQRRNDSRTDSIDAFDRRSFLGGLASVTAIGLSGCMGLFTERGAEGSESTPSQAARYTTVSKTETFSYDGTRTPYPGVRAIYAGESVGTLVLVYFDYSHDTSLTWWREEFPQLEDLLDDGKLRLTLMMFPEPIDRWSVMLPSALFEVRSRTTLEATWRFHEGLVSADEYSLDLLESLATQADVNPEAVITAAKSRRRRNQAFGDKAMGENSGVESLPAFRWGMERIEGTSADDIRAFIEEQYP